MTEPGNGIYALKCKDAIIFSPHPASNKTTIETVRIMRACLKKHGAPEDIFQCIEKPSIPLAQELMAICDLTIATGGPAMVKAAYSSGKPAYGVGAGNATMVIDETANIEEAARNTRISKTSDNGSGCSADGNLVVEATIYDRFLEQLQKRERLSRDTTKSKCCKTSCGMLKATAPPPPSRGPPRKSPKSRDSSIPAGKTFLIVEEDQHRQGASFLQRKALRRALHLPISAASIMRSRWSRQIYEVGGKGHSCGIYSFDDDHIHRLALTAPVSRMMVRQPQSKANAGAFNNGMPMTSSMGCGIWGGNITNENITLKHYMQATWVSRPIAGG